MNTLEFVTDFLVLTCVEFFLHLWLTSIELLTN